MAEIETKTVEQMIVVSLPFRGSYEHTGDKLDELMSTVMRAGYPCSGPPMGVYYDDPAKVPEAELRAEVCLPMAENYTGEGEIVRKDLVGTEVAYLMHQGPYKEIAPRYDELFEWIGEHGYRHREDLGTREIFHRIHGQVESAEELLTEVQVPIEQAE